MKGAKEYANLFKTGQYGQLYITSGFHARGKTFYIQVLPENELAKPNGSLNKCLNKNAVEVYGVISGNPGWTECYGWLHEGKWCDDFKVLCEIRKKAQKDKKETEKKENQEAMKKENERIQKLLKKY